MGRKHKFVNKTHYPDWAIERLTRSIYDDVLAFFATEEGQAEYEAWEREREELKKQKIKLTLMQQDEWEDYFNQYREACQTLSQQITQTNNEIDQRVFDIYGLTAEEREIVMDV